MPVENILFPRPGYRGYDFHKPGRYLGNIGLGIFAPIRIERFIESCRKGDQIRPDFDAEDAWRFKKQMILLSPR